MFSRVSVRVLSEQLARFERASQRVGAQDFATWVRDTLVAEADRILGRRRRGDADEVEGAGVHEEST